jgi:hypothetical protein
VDFAGDDTARPARRREAGHVGVAALQCWADRAQLDRRFGVDVVGDVELLPPTET